jgi:hypothetical protein
VLLIVFNEMTFLSVWAGEYVGDGGDPTMGERLMIGGAGARFFAGIWTGTE